MQRIAVLMAGVVMASGAGAAMAAAPADFLPKIRCLAAFEAAAATLEPDADPNAPDPDARDPNARERDTSRDPPDVVALRQRLDEVGEQFGREVESAAGLTDRDREAGDRAYDQESERLFTMLESARDQAAMDRAFQTLKGVVDRCFSMARK